MFGQQEFSVLSNLQHALCMKYWALPSLGWRFADGRFCLPEIFVPKIGAELCINFFWWRLFFNNPSAHVKNQYGGQNIRRTDFNCLGHLSCKVALFRFPWQPFKSAPSVGVWKTFPPPFSYDVHALFILSTHSSVNMNGRADQILKTVSIGQTKYDA